MKNSALEYTPADDSPSTSMLATSSESPILGNKRAPSTDSDDGRRQRPRHESQTINNLGISANVHAVNVGSDYFMHDNDSLGAENDEELDGKVFGWLSPDVSQNFNAARRKHHPGTGDWFLDSPQFQEWKETPNTVLCIYGAPGCGKTILCSTIIEAVIDWCESRLLSGWAYFFFDSRNSHDGLQLYDGFLRSVVSQLCSRCDAIPEAIRAMYQTHRGGKEWTSVKALEETLRQVIEAFDDVYIMVDSLDECGDRYQLLKWIETFARWTSARWHLLTTSRLEPDITSHLERIHNSHTVHLKGMVLEKDISLFLDEQLSFINHWSELIRALVKATLIKGADGMFRWVALQIDSLQHCFKVKEFKAKLMVLPKDLDETYERILASSSRQDDLLQMLYWLAFSARVLRVEELAEVLSIDFGVEGGPCHNPDLRYANPHSAHTVCYGLVTVTDGTVKLAHLSVKEYLISYRIKAGSASRFSISEHLSQSIIAQSCAAYLLIFNKPDSGQAPVEENGRFPLRMYAAEHLKNHLKFFANKDLCPALVKLLLQLFTSTRSSALVNWIRLCDPDSRQRPVDIWLHKPVDTWFCEPPDIWLRKPVGKVAHPLYYASLIGLKEVVENLAREGVNVNIPGGTYGSALQAAACNGNTEIVELLLKHDAHVNTHNGLFGAALPAAANGGHIQIVHSLLEHGADPNLAAGMHGTTLHVAANRGHTDIIQLLLDLGVDVNCVGGKYGTALHVAANSGHTQTARSLLEHGAYPNLAAGIHGTALHAAANGGHTETVLLLLEHVVDINLAPAMRSALQVAVQRGHTNIIKMLLEHGANVNCVGDNYGTALHAAVESGHTEIVKLLVEHGADITIRAGRFGTILQAAAAAAVRQRYLKSLEPLVKHGADFTIHAGPFGTALLAAAYNGHSHTVKLLIERGANINDADRMAGTALQTAALAGRTETVKLLLRLGADINCVAGLYGTALQAAVNRGHADTAELLLDSGADINCVAGFYDTALSAARCSQFDTREIEWLLIERGALEMGDLVRR